MRSSCAQRAVIQSSELETWCGVEIYVRYRGARLQSWHGSRLEWCGARGKEARGRDDRGGQTSVSPEILVRGHALCLVRDCSFPGMCREMHDV